MPDVRIKLLQYSMMYEKGFPSLRHVAYVYKYNDVENSYDKKGITEMVGFW